MRLLHVFETTGDRVVLMSEAEWNKLERLSLTESDLRTLDIWHRKTPAGILFTASDAPVFCISPLFRAWLQKQLDGTVAELVELARDRKRVRGLGERRRQALWYFLKRQGHMGPKINTQKAGTGD